MLGFLYAQLDFFFFVVIVICFLICKFSFVNSKIEQQNKLWYYLTFFSLFFGLRIASDMVSLAGYGMRIVGSSLSALAFLFLMEYAKKNTNFFCNSRYFKWSTLFVGLLAVIFLCIFGEQTFDLFVRIGVCLFGGVWASVVILLKAKKRKLYYWIAFFICGLSIIHFIRLGQGDVFSIWTRKNNVGLILVLLGVVFSTGILVITNLCLNFNFSLSGITKRTYLRYGAVLILVFTTWIITKRMTLNEQRNNEVEMLEHGKLLAATVNQENVKALTFSVEDEKTQDFKRLKESFVEEKNANAKLRFVYLVGVKDNRVLFYVDSDPVDSPDYAKPGTPWDDAPAGVKSTFLNEGGAFISGPYTDKWGTWISSCSPITDLNTHKTLAVLCMDTSAITWTVDIVQTRLFGILIGLYFFICLMIFFVIYELGMISANAIKKSETKFYMAFERSPLLTAISTLEDGRFIDVNETFYKTIGYANKQEMVGKNSVELNIFRDGYDTLNLVDSIKEEGSVNDLELNIQTKTGETIVGLYHGSVIEIAGRKCLVSIIEDITQRKKEQNEFKERAKNQQLLTSILHILNTPSPDFHGTISHIITEIKQTTGFDAVGIRLQKGDDFPYFSQDGFSDDFLLTENTLAVRDDGGGVCRDKDGNICMECTCGLVISGQADPSNPLFTPDGSCWTNNSLPLLDLPADQDPRLHPRNNCIHEGYSSVALIPIRTDNKIVGLLQLNDKLKNRFTIDLIQFFESMCSSIGIGIIRKQVEEELAKSNLLLTTQQEVGIDGILSIDAEGGILSYNKRFIEMWGITPEVIALKSEEHLVQSVLDKLTNPQEFIKKVKNIYENKGEKYRDEIALIDGRIFDRYSAPMFNDNDQYYGRVLFFRDITEQVKLQNAIKENEQYFRTMWESLQAGVAVIDAETFNIVDVNAAALRILKGKKEDVVGHNCGRYICSSECQNCPVMAQGKEVNNRETVFKDLEGNTIPVLKTVEKIELKGKTYLLENFIEITKLKEAQKRLEESEVRFRDIATSMSDWIWEANNEGIYTYCSENVYDFLGYHTNEMLGKKILDFTSPEDWERIIKVIMEANKTKAPFKDVESRRIKKDGTQIIVSASGAPILDKEGSLLGYRGIETDITERKMVEENIRQLSQAVEQSPATIVITDTEGLIEYTNPKFSSLTGYTAEEAKGQNPKILKAGDMPAEHYKTLWDTIKAGSEWRGEMHNKKKNEELYWEYASVSPIKNAAGNITHFLAVKEDITERKKLESALQETQEALLRTSKIKDEFLSITSHDLKSPLGIVKTSMSLLLDESDITPATKEYAALSLRQANKGLKLISDLLDLKKLETGDVRLEPTKFHFARLIDEILHDFGKSYEQADVSLSASSDDDYEINADYNKVGQVISNLLGNALKFTSKGGSVKINTSLVQKQDVDKVTREYLKVSVSDTGIGIPEDKIKKIFEKYEQASSTDKKIGTGLGLAIAKYVCGLHHGEIWVESKVGQGSNFIFILPYSKEIQELYYDENSCLPYKILIVDDMDDQRFITKSLLRKGNFHSEEASNWRDALDKIRTNNFSLVLLDIEMPDINGYELLEIIRREKTVTELPVIMYSSKQIDNDRCNHLGVSCFILKERAADELVAQIRRTLGVV